MSPSLSRNEVVAALIRHPNLDLEPSHPKDIWALAAGEVVSPQARDAIETRVERMDEALAIEEEYNESGIWILTCADGNYPHHLQEKLGRKAPALLYGFGNQELLADGGIGVVGSRNLDGMKEEVTRKAAEVIAGGHRCLVSGGARGVDRISMEEALKRGGKVVGVLAHSLLESIDDGAFMQEAELGLLCLITPYRPDMGFTVANAMARNKIVYALSDCTLVVAADLETGGSWAGATEALRHGFSRVVVWSGEGAGEGNQALINRGAVPVTDVARILDLEWLDSEAGRLEPQQQFDFGDSRGV